ASAMKPLWRKSNPKASNRTSSMRLLIPALMVLTALSAPVQAETAYPLTLDNCGVSVTFESAPERVVTIKSTATELLLSLGLADKIVGIGFQDGPLPDHLAVELPVLSEKLPSQEVV